MKYWLSDHNGFVGGAGSNPFVPTLFKRDYLTLEGLKYLVFPAFVGFFVFRMMGRFGYEQMAYNFKRIYWILP